jgi:hypothetical protein
MAVAEEAAHPLARLVDLGDVELGQGRHDLVGGQEVVGAAGLEDLVLLLDLRRQTGAWCWSVALAVLGGGFADPQDTAAELHRQAKACLEGPSHPPPAHPRTVKLLQV